MFTVSEHACVTPVALRGAVHVGCRTAAFENVPVVGRPLQVADHAWVSAWPRESTAVTVSATAPSDDTGFGDPLAGPVTVIASGTEFTRCSIEPPADLPCPSVTVTDSVHACCAPVRFAGAAHVGFAVEAFGVNVPEPVNVGQVADQAKPSTCPYESLADTDSAVLPLDETGFTELAGPAVIARVCGAASILDAVLADADWPWPSLAVTRSVQGCCAPVRFAGAVQLGLCVPAEGVKLPALGSPAHVASQHRTARVRSCRRPGPRAWSSRPRRQGCRQASGAS